MNMPYIETIDYEDASGEIKEIYEQLKSSRGKIAEIHKIQSLNPKALVAHMELYMATMFAKSPLKRAQREMIAVVVSASNKCDYCIEHHAVALDHFWKDRNRVNQLAIDFETLDLEEGDLALCRYSKHLTETPADGDGKARVQMLKELGFSDRAILDATQVVAYFNFVNRMVLGLGVEFTEEESKGYKYK